MKPEIRQTNPAAQSVSVPGLFRAAPEQTTAILSLIAGPAAANKLLTYLIGLAHSEAEASPIDFPKCFCQIKVCKNMWVILKDISERVSAP